MSIAPELVRSRLRIRLTSTQYSALQAFLIPGDGLEAVAILICGRGGNAEDELLLVNEVLEVPYGEYSERSANRVTWPTDVLVPVLRKLKDSGFGLIKIHSHPEGHKHFSSWDDASDRELFPGVYAWSGTDRPHLSAIMLADGSIMARVVKGDGSFGGNAEIAVIGNHIQNWTTNESVWHTHPMTARTAQAFGDATVESLRRLTIGVVGCSGTGSWVVEQLGRLGVGTLVLVDPDHVEMVNLNRIVHATVEDARQRRPKVQVLSDALQRTGLPVRIESFVADVYEPTIVRRLSRCDAIFGCVDTVDARELMSRISTYYILPYFDVGVRLVADGLGGISHIVGSVNYVHPDAPSLMERGLYTPKQLADAGLRRSDPVAYSKQLDAGYISGAEVARPAVASVNAFYASLAVNELLERIHAYRDEAAPLGVTISLSQLRVLQPVNSPATPAMVSRTGRGDSRPLLGLPVLSGQP